MGEFYGVPMLARTVNGRENCWDGVQMAGVWTVISLIQLKRRQSDLGNYIYNI
jgi:hypothetical protein